MKSLEIYPDEFFWLPSYFFVRHDSQEEIEYCGYEWALLIYLWGIEIQILG